jgi:acetyltransferase-like isoleucine patch superfamily enzyme
LTPSPFNIWFYRRLGMKIGKHCQVNSTHISDPSLISLGDRVTVGGSVTLVAHYGQGGFLILAPVVIEDQVTLGLKATVMGGVRIGRGAKVLPHSVILPKTQIPEGETWGGVPARKILPEELALSKVA